MPDLFSLGGYIYNSKNVFLIPAFGLLLFVATIVPIFIICGNKDNNKYN